MKWKNLFTSETLKRGEQYFKSGKVTTIMSLSVGRYTANVKGSGHNQYNTFVSFAGGEIESIKCTCPYASGGRTCKHMAAMLFALEKDEGSALFQHTREPINPFAVQDTANDKDSYHYYNFGRIAKDLVIYDDTYEKAVNLLNQGKVIAKTIDTGYSTRDGSAGCIVEGEAKRGSSSTYPVRISFDKDEMVDMGCAVYGCKSYYNGYNITQGKKEPCEHTLALMIAANRYISENDYGDSTNAAAFDLLQAFRKNRSASQTGMATSRDVTLEPRITKENNRLKLSFRIGCDKLYVVRNLTDLVKCVEDKEEIAFGKLALHFARDKIRPQDMPLYQFIKNVIDDEAYHSEQLKKQYYYYNVREFSVKSDIPLFGQRLDSFFDMAEGGSVPFTDKDKSAKQATKNGETLSFGHESPKIKLKVVKDVDRYGVFHGVDVTGTAPNFFRTPRYRYYLKRNVLNRISSDNTALEPIYDLIDDKGKIFFRIGRQNLSEFYYTVLPQLREAADVEEADTELVDTYLPPEVKFVFYLDLIDDVPICRAVSQYGDIQCSTMDCMDDGKIKERFRDVYREAQAIEVVQRYFPKLDLNNSLFVCEDSEDALYDLLENGITALSQLGEVQGSDQFYKLRIRPKVQVKVGVSVESDLMNLTIGSTDVSPEELLEILRSYQRKKRYHRLKSGDFVNIGEDIFELGAMIDTLHLSQKELLNGNATIPSYRALYLDKMSEDCDALDIKRDKYFKKIIQGFKTVNESDFEVPDHLQDIMRNYQVYGHKWLRTLEAYGFGGILADDMGLGKTLQMISVFSAAKTEDKTGTSIVICPSSLVYNWIEELSRFAPELSAIPIVGTQKERVGLIQGCMAFDVVVTSYDLFKRDVELYEGKTFLYQVIDEAQYIKTHTTAAAKSVKLMQSKTRFALTGTPIENRLSELWSIFDYLMPGFLYGYETFKKEFETPITKKNDEEATKRLKRMVSPFILRRLKTDVLKDLPDKIEEVRYAKFGKEQQLIYDSQVVYMKQMVDEQDDESVKKNKLQILAELTKIRQICCDPSLLLEDYKGESAKRETCLDLINSAIEGEHRILLFSQFTSMLALLEEDLRGAGIAYYKITGSTPKKERMELVQRFNAGTTPVFLISLKAGGTGLNLTGADVVIHYDPWWNVAAQNQATDRAHRIGQTRTVSVYRIIVKDSIEEKILNLQELKKDLADEILAGGTGTTSLAEMSKDDLIDLLS